MKALVFGEILWDIFGEEKKIGGAAFNFAAHLASLGDEAHFASGIGRDELGAQARQCVRELGVWDDYLVDTPRPTGMCRVTLDGAGTPHYELVDQVGYDFITLDKIEPMDMLYFGTLARRAPVSRASARRLLDCGLFKEIFLDVNVRKPFISADVLREGLEKATILKVSREEYRLIEDMQLVSVAPGGRYEESLCRALAARYPQMRLVIVTLDKDGAMLYDAVRDETIYSAKPVSRLVSAVGAGDSFSACFMHNLLHGKSLGESLDRGVLLSDYVVTQMGAVPACPPELLEKIR